MDKSQDAKGDKHKGGGKGGKGGKSRDSDGDKNAATEQVRGVPWMRAAGHDPRLPPDHVDRDQEPAKALLHASA